MAKIVNVVKAPFMTEKVISHMFFHSNLSVFFIRFRMGMIFSTSLGMNLDNVVNLPTSFGLLSECSGSALFPMFDTCWDLLQFLGLLARNP